MHLVKLVEHHLVMDIVPSNLIYKGKNAIKRPKNNISIDFSTFHSFYVSRGRSVQCRFNGVHNEQRNHMKTLTDAT